VWIPVENESQIIQLVQEATSSQKRKKLESPGTNNSFLFTNFRLRRTSHLGGHEIVSFLSFVELGHLEPSENDRTWIVILNLISYCFWNLFHT
jgi:hypothetical protein